MSNLKLQACSTPLCSEQNTSKRNPSERDREGSNNRLKEEKQILLSTMEQRVQSMRVKRGIRMLKCFSAVRIKAGWWDCRRILWETDSRERNVFPWGKLKESRNHEVCVTEMLCFLFPQTHTKIVSALSAFGQWMLSSRDREAEDWLYTVKSAQHLRRSTDCSFSRAFTQRFSSRFHYSPAVKL